MLEYVPLLMYMNYATLARHKEDIRLVIFVEYVTSVRYIKYATLVNYIEYTPLARYIECAPLALHTEYVPLGKVYAMCTVVGKQIALLSSSVIVFHFICFTSCCWGSLGVM